MKQHCSHYHDSRYHTTIRGTSDVVRFCTIDREVLGKLPLRPDGRPDLRISA